ncbi:MAG TPA: transposase [Noviherbaspirillum sp.]|jgi:transposase|uniref:transposase n=1 Tax=Noviherbaspirillum sp. TaxID=1926288 RepID=UPI002DDCB228|nr:transposase [Noviherbaspirillum sp.]HEV2609743.1 transposase [Noviherbaspirillum sp.]
MARYKSVDYHQTCIIPVSFAAQVFPGTFEHTLAELIDHELDLSIFDSRYHNDGRGAPAWHLGVLLKIILYAYARGMTSSREIERACRENITFMALSGNSRPHFTTIAGFISTMHEQIMPLFLEVLLVCDDMGLIGKDMFAIDGCKVPANVSREWSDTREELAAKVRKMERAVRNMLATHQHADSTNKTHSNRKRQEQCVQALRRKINKIKRFLMDHDDKPGKGSGGPRKSNVVDNDSVKMKTAHGTLQGYDGVATVDAKHQVVVHAQAFGVPQEHDLLMPMVEATRENFIAIDRHANIFQRTALAADSGFHTEANSTALFAQRIQAYVADKLFRKRDERFSGVAKYKQRHRSELRQSRHGIYRPADFAYDPDWQTCVCPAGKALYRNGHSCHIKGSEYVKFSGPENALRAICINREMPEASAANSRTASRVSKGESDCTRMPLHRAYEGAYRQ